MSATELSVLVFGIYMVVVGIGFTLIPNTPLRLLRFSETNESWIRVLGIVVIILGYYYIDAALAGSTDFFRATVWGRFSFLIGTIGLAITKKAKAQLVGFGLIDAAGALWTLLTLV